MAKLSEAAFRWDQNDHSGGSTVYCFEAYLTPFDFKQQLELSFGVRLSASEVDLLSLFLLLYFFII